MSKTTASNSQSAGLIVAWAGGVSVIILGVVLYFALIGPALDKRAKAVDRLERKNKQFDKQKTDLRKAESIHEELKSRVQTLSDKIDTETKQARSANPETQALRQEINQALPLWKSHRKTIGAIKEDAENTGVDFKRYVKREKQLHGPIKSQSLEIVAMGKFKQLTDFMNRLTTNPNRLLTFDNFRIEYRQAPPNPLKLVAPQDPDLKLQMKITVYFQQEEEEGEPLNLKTSTVKNKRWQTIRGAFWAYAASGMTGKRNPFLSQQSPTLAAQEGDGSLPNGEPIIPETETGETQSDVVAAPQSPVLVKHPVASYELLSVSLTPDPGFALVMAPDKKGYKITIDSKLGNAQGIVVALDKDSVIVSEPLSDEPKILKVSKD